MSDRNPILVSDRLARRPKPIVGPVPNPDEAPTMVVLCDDAFYRCRCVCEDSHDGPHVCRCEGSWEWGDGEVLIHASPDTSREIPTNDPEVLPPPGTVERWADGVEPKHVPIGAAIMAMFDRSFDDDDESDES